MGRIRWLATAGNERSDGLLLTDVGGVDLKGLQNAALLSHRLGDKHVFAVDIETELVDLKLVLLQRRGDTAEGRFDPTYGSFMGIRRAGDTRPPPRSPAASQHRDAAHQRPTTLDLTRPWEQTTFWFFAHTALPLGTSFSLRGEGPHQPPRNTVLHASDGSWCEVREDRESNGTRAVWESGPHRPWQIIEDTHAQWCQLGRPGWERFGLTATPSGRSIWLDTVDSEHTWPRPHPDQCLLPPEDG